MIKSTYIIALFFIHSCLFSQNMNHINSPVKEQLVLQINSNYYLTGESILYKTTCLNATSKEVLSASKIAYVELLNHDNETILKHKQFIDGGVSFNDFFIPTTVQTGEYKIIAYTNLMLNSNEYTCKKIFIINPYLPFPEEFKETNLEASKEISPISKSNSNSQVKTNKTEYQKREKVILNINDNLKGNFILNVIKTDSIPVDQEKYSRNLLADLKQENLEINANTTFPETRGEIFRGKIIAKNSTDPLENKKIAFSIPGEVFDFKITTTDKNGNFKFLVDTYNGEDAYFQIYEKDKEKYKIEVFDNQNIKFKISNDNIKIKASYANSILKRSIANQIQNIYYHTKSDTIFSNKKTLPFYTGSDKEYVLVDYKPQNTIREVFIEIIPEVYINKKNNKYVFNVNDYEVNDSDLYFNTLVLVDGFLLQDVDEILTFDPNHFTKINFVNKGYFLNNYLFNGVVNLTTKEFNYIPHMDGDYIIKKKLERPQLKKKYFNINYTKNSFEKIPDYRYQLYWEPNVTDISTEKSFEFYTSDISGNYKVVIEGITKNGEPILMENYFSVK